MKRKRIALFGLSFVFLASTAVVSANNHVETGDVLHHETVEEEYIEQNEENLEIPKPKDNFGEEKEGDKKESESIKQKGEDISNVVPKEPDLQIKPGKGALESDSDIQAIEIEVMPLNGLKKDFEVDGATLIKYNGTDEKAVVPDGIEVIGKEAFKGNSHVKELILSDSVKSAESEAFAYMENLEVIEKGPGFYTEYDNIYDGSDKLSEFKVRNNFE